MRRSVSLRISARPTAAKATGFAPAFSPDGSYTLTNSPQRILEDLSREIAHEGSSSRTRVGSGPAQRIPPSLLSQMAAEELSRDGEDARPFDATHFRPASRVFAQLHLKRPGHLVQIGAIEKGVRQSVDQPESDLVPAPFKASYSMTL